MPTIREPQGNLIFPTPQRLNLSPTMQITLPRRRLTVALPAQDGALLADIIRRLEGRLGPLHTAPAGAPADITIALASEGRTAARSVPLQPEGYLLQADPDGISVTGRDLGGCYYGVLTLLQLLQQRGGAWSCPAGTVEDWPDFRQRGLFIEDFWGTDLMELPDYEELLERCACLKLNTLIVALCGGWEIKHHGRLTEFLMVPLRRHPELQTPQLVRYFDPDERRWVERCYLPRMAEQDYLGRLIEAAARRHITVIPLWGGPAHVTLLSRLHPEISARNAAGQPTRYGYCLSQPETWELLFDILDEITEHYLLPHGLTRLHIAGDEIYPIRSVYEEDPLAEASPWCRCPACSQHSEAALLTQYVVRLASHLKSRGIQTMIWQDTFERLNGMDTLWRGLVEAGLERDISMNWWCYKEPLPRFGERLALENWVQPSVGTLASVFHQDLSRNIFAMLRRGAEIGAAGATAYNVPDPAQHKNYHELAEWAWNQSGCPSIPHFALKYARAFFGEAWIDALEGYDVAERIFGSYPLIVYVLDQLLYYFQSYPYGVREYPADLLAGLASDRLALPTALRQSVAHLEAAKVRLERCRPYDRAGLVPLMRHECDRVISVTQAMLDTLHALGSYQEARRLWAADPADALRELDGGRRLLAASLHTLLHVMQEDREVKPAYLWPAVWREVSYLASAMQELVGQMEEAAQQAQAGALVELPALPLLARVGEGRLHELWHPWEF